MMNLMDRAQERMPNVPLLVNVVARRVRQLNAGQRPMVKPGDQFTSNFELALREVSEGKLAAETAVAPAQQPSAAESLLAL
jgi:DNA-directed RNA polymerase subunit omega